MRPKTFLAPAAFLLLASLAVRLGAQAAPPQTPPDATAAPAGAAGRGAPQGAGAPPQGRGRGQATFPAQQRPPGDPEVIKRGNGLYGVNCRACHGTDLRGGDQGGPNLLRSQLVLNDQDGELILPVVQHGRQNPGMPVMPPLPIPPDDVKAIADLHPQRDGQRAGSGRASRRPAGRAEHRRRRRQGGSGLLRRRNARRATRRPTCRASRRACRIRWRSRTTGSAAAADGAAAGAPPTPVTAIVVDASGQKTEGRLIRLDDFSVVVALADGTSRSFRRDGDVPKVEVRDPREAHRKLLPTYADKDIHDVTAYLVTLK